MIIVNEKEITIMTTFLTVLGWVFFLAAIICVIISDRVKDKNIDTLCGCGCVVFCILALGLLICAKPKETKVEENQTLIECNEEEKKSSNYNINNTNITNKEYNFSFNIDFSIFR